MVLFAVGGCHGIPFGCVCLEGVGVGKMRPWRGTPIPVCLYLVRLDGGGDLMLGKQVRRTTTDLEGGLFYIGYSSVHLYSHVAWCLVRCPWCPRVESMYTSLCSCSIYFFLLNSHGHRGGCTEQDAAAQAYKSFPYSTRRVLRTPCAGVWTVVIPTVAEVISSAAVVSLWLE